MKKALITGITGQDGSYLAELLLEKGYEVHGLVRRTSTFNRGRIDHLTGKDPHVNKASINLHYGDLVDSSSIDRIMSEIEPDEIYNLAAQSHVGVSFKAPEYTANVTGIGCLRILESAKNFCPEAKIYQASTSELYGNVNGDIQNEETSFNPCSPYATAKLYAYWVTKNYRESYNLFACNGILFNHESPRRGENFVTRKITLSISKILDGKLDKLYIGNLDAKRDWGYAPEYVEGMWLMLQQEEPEDYVLATGETHSVREFIEKAFSYVDIDIKWKGEGVEEIGFDEKSGKEYVVVDPRYFRPNEVKVLKGDASKANKKLNWKATTSLESLVNKMMKHELNKK